jgi:hypothetical protein
MNVLLTIGIISISVISIYLSVKTNGKEYRITVFKLKQELYDSFQHLKDVVIEYEKFDNYLEEVLDSEMPDVGIMSGAIVDYYDDNIKNLDRVIRAAFNKSDYLYLEEASGIDPDLKKKYLEWCDALYEIKNYIQDNPRHAKDPEILLAAIEKLLLITPYLIENLDKATDWLQKDLRKSLPKQTMLLL